MQEPDLILFISKVKINLKKKYSLHTKQRKIRKIKLKSMGIGPLYKWKKFFFVTHQLESLPKIICMFLKEQKCPDEVLSHIYSSSVLDSNLIICIELILNEISHIVLLLSSCLMLTISRVLLNVIARGISINPLIYGSEIPASTIPLAQMNTLFRIYIYYSAVYEPLARYRMCIKRDTNIFRRDISICVNRLERKEA